MFLAIPCLDFPMHKSFQVPGILLCKNPRSHVLVLFPALKVLCIEKSAKDLDVDIELSSCWFRDVGHLESN